MSTRQRFGRRWFVASALAMAVILSAGSLQAIAQNGVVIAASAPQGVTLSNSASGSIDPSPDMNVLLLEGRFIGACTAGQFHHSSGPVLVFVESYQVTIRFTAQGHPVDQRLTQGLSTVVPANTTFTLINDMVDNAFPAEVLLLAGTKWDTSSTPSQPIAPTAKLLTSLDSWPAESHCQSISNTAKLQRTFMVNGAAGIEPSHLYLGIGVWTPGGTTDGFGIADQAASFNLMILAGGMENAGYGSGRAFHAGPRQVLRDAYNEQLAHTPFTNSGASPIVGIIFGTAGDGPVLVPVR